MGDCQMHPVPLNKRTRPVLFVIMIWFYWEVRGEGSPPAARVQSESQPEANRGPGI